MMLALSWLTVLLGVLAMLWADGALAKLAISPKRVRSVEPCHFRRRIL
jgi:hypothetical protein